MPIGVGTPRRLTPNDAHRALARLEAMGRSKVVLTQNVDRLHQAAGNDRVIDLHGRLDLVRCMACGRKMMREEMQDRLGRLNADWLELDAADAPDGDADLEVREFTSFSVPACPHCEGMLKPDVVFFGETVSRDVVDAAAEHLRHADAMLIVGSSLMYIPAFVSSRWRLAAGSQSLRLIWVGRELTKCWRSRWKRPASRRCRSCCNAG